MKKQRKDHPLTAYSVILSFKKRELLGCISVGKDIKKLLNPKKK
ncbi:MAG: hypothetical protein NTX61_02765 [Bacteroidetes bacterium]|nr:hypothetical protein [Bacteroidota bacterium]